MPDVSGLVPTTDLNIEIEGKSITDSNNNKFTSDILDTKIKQKELFNKSDISNLMKDFDLKIKHATLGTKAELKAEQHKIVKLQTVIYINFLAKIFFGDDGSQNIFVYQPTLDTFRVKNDKETDYVLSWKSKRVYTSKLKPLCIACLRCLLICLYCL